MTMHILFKGHSQNVRDEIMLLLGKYALRFVVWLIWERDRTGNENKPVFLKCIFSAFTELISVTQMPDLLLTTCMWKV